MPASAMFRLMWKRARVGFARSAESPERLRQPRDVWWVARAPLIAARGRSFWRLLIRLEEHEPHMPCDGLAGMQRDHAGVHAAPFLAKGIGKVELLLDGGELFRRRRVDLDGTQLRREAEDVDAVIARRVGEGHVDGAVGALQLRPVVIEVDVVERLAL